MGEQPRRRGTPGGSLPPHLAAPRKPASNGHVPDRPLGLRRGSWEEIDAEDDLHLAAQRTPFRRLVDIDDRQRVRTSGGPSPAVIIGVALVLALVALAVILYRLAPP